MDKMINNGNNPQWQYSSSSLYENLTFDNDMFINYEQNMLKDFSPTNFITFNN